MILVVHAFSLWVRLISIRAGPEEARDRSGASRALPGTKAHAAPPRRDIEKGDRLTAGRVQNRV